MSITQVNTGSENTIKAYEVLKGATSAMTIREVADALGVTPAKVTGGIVSLEKKGILAKSEVTQGEKTYKAYTVVDANVEFVFNAPKQMSDKAVSLLQFLQGKGDVELTAQEIAEELGMQAIAINGVVNGLVTRNLAERVEQAITMPDGTEKTLKFITLTDEGKAYQF